MEKTSSHTCTCTCDEDKQIQCICTCTLCVCWFLYSHVLILTTFIFFYLSTCAYTCCIYPHVLLLSHMCLYSSTCGYPNTHVLILIHACLTVPTGSVLQQRSDILLLNVPNKRLFVWNTARDIVRAGVKVASVWSALQRSC